jgi:hypothetical protein
MYPSIAATSNEAGRAGEADWMTDGTEDAAGDGASMLCALQPMHAAKSRKRTWSLTGLQNARAEPNISARRSFARALLNA